MPLPVKIQTPRRPARAVTPSPTDASALDMRGPKGAMAPGPAAVVMARSLAGNAAVTSAMGGLPRGAEPTPSGWAGQMLLVGQGLVGNQAVVAQAGALPTAPQQTAPKKKAPPKPVQKAKAPPSPAPDQKDKPTAERGDKGPKKEAAGPRAPGADPKFQALTKDVAAKKRTVGTSHPPAIAEAGAAQGAAVPPADDREARGKAAHSEDMDAAQPKEFDKQSFIAAVEKAIRDRAPKNLDEANDFGKSGKAEEVKTEVAGKVGEGKDAAACEIADTTEATPQPAPDAKEVVPLAADKVPGKPGTPNPNQAAPDTLPPSATDMSAGPAKVDGLMASADVTEKQLQSSKEPTFEKAVADKKTMEAHSATAPGELRAGEARELKQVKGSAATSGAAAMGAMHGTRVNCGRQVTTGKEGTKGRDEEKRTQVTAVLQKVFDDTKCDVEKILAELDKKVDDQFTKGEKRARDRFTDEHTRGMDEYKDRRYSGLTGKARWVRDLFADLPEEANRIYERARDNYLTAMRQVISEVADTVVAELKRAKDRIAKGRTDLKQAVDTLPKDLRAIGREAAADFEGKFDELQDTVNDKGTELVDTLATRYTDAVKSVDAEIAAEKEKNKGLVSKASEAIGGVINTIKELGRLLMGVLAKAASAVGLILRDPIGFLGRLIAGVGGGLTLFGKNAGRHLQQGVLGWLLGSGVSGGLQLPTTFDILGILVMIAALLGISWPNIRAKLARRVSPKVMTAAETGKDAIPMVVDVKKRGVTGMWGDLRSRVGDLKKDLIGKLVAYLLPTILIAGITWIVSLFSPASAFIRACKMIIDIVRFIVTNARQIIEFVNAVLDAVIAIARGGTGGVPALIERALARSIPILIGALAALLGIGGIGGKVKQIFQQIARPVNRAIDWVIAKMAGLLKKLAAKLKPRPKKPKRPKRPERPKRPRDRTKPRHPRPRRPRTRKDDRPPKRKPVKKDEKKPEEAKRRARRPTVKVPFMMAGTAHTVTLKPSGKGLTVTMASVELPLTDTFFKAFNKIADFRDYMESIQDLEVKQFYQEEFEEFIKLKERKPPTVEEFTAVYENVFPPGQERRELSRDEARAAAAKVRPLVNRAEKLLDTLKKWANEVQAAGLAPDDFETIIKKGHKIWEDRWRAIQKRIDAIIKLPQFKYNGNELKYRGSVKKGFRSPPKGRTRFDATDFDVDFYVVDAEKFNQFRTANPDAVAGDKIFADRGPTDLQGLQQRIRVRLVNEFKGVEHIDQTSIVLREVDKPD